MPAAKASVSFGLVSYWPLLLDRAAVSASASMLSYVTNNLAYVCIAEFASQDGRSPHVVCKQGYRFHAVSLLTRQPHPISAFRVGDLLRPDRDCSGSSLSHLIVQRPSELLPRSDRDCSASSLSHLHLEAIWAAHPSVS